MATYAEASDLDALPLASREWLPTLVAEREALILEAEWAVDRILTPGREYALTERVLDPALLSPRQRAALRRAVVFCVEYLLAIAEEDVLGGRIEILAAGSVAFSPFTRDRPPGPRAWEALAATGLLRRSGVPYEPPEVAL